MATYLIFYSYERFTSYFKDSSHFQLISQVDLNHQMQNMQCQYNPTYYLLDLDTSQSHIEENEYYQNFMEDEEKEEDN